MISGSLADRQKTISDSWNQYNAAAAEARQLHLCDGFRPEHGFNTPLDSTQERSKCSPLLLHKANTRLPMGYAGSSDIFKSEMMKLMEALEYVRAYIEDLLVITRGTL